MKLILLSTCLLPIFIFAQLNMTQLGYLDVVSMHGNSEANDIWGYVDGSGNEYAIVGLNDGTSIVDVTDPANPFEVFYEPGSNSIWRDIKTWGQYAYVTTEAEDGLLIIDMSTLPGNTNLNTQYYFGPSGDEWQTSHNLYIDENGYCYIFGANRGNGGTIILDLNPDPMNPIEVGVSDIYYTHDGVVRGDTLYQAHIEDGFFTISDISDKSNPIALGQQITPGVFAHNLWFNDDGDYLYTTDEISNGYIGEYDISDPLNIVETDRIQSSPGMNVIPHNVHFLNDYIITSYYRDGVTIHDVSNKGNMVEVGNYDTAPTLSGDGFNGCWGVYPWLPSGNIIASDIENGLHILGANYTRGCYLEGIVTNSVSFNPVYDATIEIIGVNIQNNTNLQGEYETGIATAGTYDIIYAHPAYIDDTIFGVTLTNGNTVTQDVQLVPLIPQDVTISVSEDIFAVQIENAQVSLSNDDFTYTGTTDANGTATLTNIIPGNYTLTVGKWEFVTECNDYVIDASTTTINTTLVRGYYDDFIFDFNWTISGNAPDGVWERAIPFGTSSNGQFANPNEDYNDDCGNFAYVTGNSNTPGIGDDDVDIADAILTSPLMDLSSYNSPIVTAKIWWVNFGGFGNPNDSLQIFIHDGNNKVRAHLKTSNQTNNQWVDVSFRISDYIIPTNTMSISFETADWQANGGHIVEAGVDYFQVTDGQDASVSEHNLLYLNVFPNPNNGNFNIKVSPQLIGKHFEIIDLLGKTIHSQIISESQMVISGLKSGVYLVRVLSSDQYIVKKVVINN